MGWAGEVEGEEEEEGNWRIRPYWFSLKGGGEEAITYSTAAAACSGFDVLAGTLSQVALTGSPRGPREEFFKVPPPFEFCVERRVSLSCQHWKTEVPLTRAMVVRLRCAASADDCARVTPERIDKVAKTGREGNCIMRGFCVVVLRKRRRRRDRRLCTLKWWLLVEIGVMMSALRSCCQEGRFSYISIHFKSLSLEQKRPAIALVVKILYPFSSIAFGPQLQSLMAARLTIIHCKRLPWIK